MINFYNINNSIILFIVLFIIIWIMHKPFDVHNTKLNNFHKWLEIALVIQGLFILNYFLLII